MSDTKLLQTIIDRVSSVGKKVDSLEQKVDGGFEGVNKRLDTIGTPVARLEDDTPTIDEFGNLGKRVSKIERQTSKN